MQLNEEIQAKNELKMKSNHKCKMVVENKKKFTYRENVQISYDIHRLVKSQISLCTKINDICNV